MRHTSLLPQTTHSRMLLSLLIIIVGGVLALLLYPAVHPSSGMSFEHDAGEMETQVARMLTHFGLDRSAHDITARLVMNNDVVHAVLERYRAPEGYALLRERGNGYSWTMQVREKDPASVTVSIGQGPDEKQLRRMIAGDLQLAFDMHGKLHRIDLPIEDSVRLASRSPAAAFRELRVFLLTRAVPRLLGPISRVESVPDSLSSATAFSGITYSMTRQAYRVDHRFSWTVHDDVLQDSIDVEAEFKGSMLAAFNHTYRSIGDVDAGGDLTVVNLIEIGVFIALIIILVVAGFRRMRTDEIGFSSALVVGIGTTILFSIYLFLQVFSQMDLDLEAAASLLIAPVMVGGGITLLWAVSEAVGRETWREKFISLDLTMRGHVLHSRVGRSVLEGTAAGVMLLLLALLSAWVVSFSRTVWMPQESNDAFSWLGTSLPVLFLAGEALISNLAGFAFFVLFLLSLLQQRLRRSGIVLSAGTIILVAIDLPNIVPVPEALIVQLPVVFLLLLLFYRTDVLTTLLAMVTFSLLQQGIFMLLPWNTALLDQGMLLLALLGGTVLYSMITISTPDRQLDFEAVAPRFQRHISERQRLARELEIARDVQMSFLPKRTPHIDGLDIAAHCAPALEVGGDYYDFIEMGPTKVGLAIGDVSGKGTQAAFYMTLTKGFLKALGEQSESPSRVLGHLNRLFYENVERGHFISMIYAVFDMELHTVTIARAGHTPVIRRNADASVETIQSRGMALGFEAGRTFTSTIEEIVLPLRTGDVLLFYTDGYPEAMTRKREEFGEQRLTASLQSVSGESAEDVFNHIHRETRRFTGTAKQHDDMTMVVVRVT